MNPDKLFEYLEGNLTPDERAALEELLAREPHLQRELAVAREIHRGMRQSRELVGVEFATDPATDRADARGAVLSRRVAIAFAALVAVNVIGGVLWIAHESRQPSRAVAARDAALREQLRRSFGVAAAQALPVPSLERDEIHLNTRPEEREAMVARVVAAAEKLGGTATKAPADAASTSVLVQIPAARELEFRQAIGTVGGAVGETAEGTKFLQVQIGQPVPGH